MNTLYTCYLITNKLEKVPPIESSIAPETLEVFDGTGYPSFSKLVNSCVVACPTEIVVIFSDKMMPTAENIQKLVTLVEQGYAFVGLYRFGFFGFKKELFRQIGTMDERYLGGWHEDDDMYLRLGEAGLGVYITQEVEYNKGPSGWAHGAAIEHYRKKWNLINPGVTRADDLVQTISEETHHYNLGPSIPTIFLPAEHSHITPGAASNLYYSREATKHLKKN
jgi:hypothetical protein